MNRLVMVVLKNITLVPAAWVKLCKYAKHTDEYSYEEKWKHIRYILKHVCKSGNIDLKVTGLDNIPEEDGFLMCGNHQGIFDIVAIVDSFERPLAAVLKKELNEIPFLKQIVQCTHSYPMDRDDVRQSMKVIQSVAKELEDGRNIIIFPEGTRSKDGNNMGEFHAGTFKCVMKSKAPIVPFALIDSYKVLDQDGCDPLKVQLHYLEPIYYEEYKDLKTNEIAALVKDRIGAAIEKNIEAAS
ncbi:MAG: 1-acyl-sn-glycerol-3-phosphate acyltransferase [Agathobacter sp.]|nr:1-acyl-sn-glycerol-3-phosphate acyltransferase [Agathobacter sp.]